MSIKPLGKPKKTKFGGLEAASLVGWLAGWLAGLAGRPISRPPKSSSGSFGPPVFIKSSFSCLGSSCIHVLFDSYLEVMINPRLTTLAPYVSIPHSVLNQNAMYPLWSFLIEFLIERDTKQFFLNVDETNKKRNG